MARDNLNGQPFIAETYKIGDEDCSRTCFNCFYRHHDGIIPAEDCLVKVSEGERDPHELFGYKGQNLPETVDGKDIGNYCPMFVDWRAE